MADVYTRLYTVILFLSKEKNEKLKSVYVVVEPYRETSAGQLL